MFPGRQRQNSSVLHRQEQPQRTPFYATTTKNCSRADGLHQIVRQNQAAKKKSNDVGHRLQGPPPPTAATDSGYLPLSTSEVADGTAVSSHQQRRFPYVVVRGLGMSARRSRIGSWALGLILGLCIGLTLLAPGRPGGGAEGGSSPARCGTAPTGDSQSAAAWKRSSRNGNSGILGGRKEGEDWEGDGGVGKVLVEDEEEGGSRSLLFVGVMTARKYLDTRAVAVYETWGRELPGRMAFFSSEGSRRPARRPDLPLVALRGVDDSYPPQKKSFMMLAYMWEHFGERFEWFLRADDDVYIRPDRLAALLRSVDSRKAYFVGQAGRGNQEEFGSLSLEYDENFCMGGPGVVLSRETLSRVAPYIKHCLKNLYTTHEDVELGRCVRRFARVSCTWSYEMQTILYHNSSGRDAFTGRLKLKEVHRAITLHPIKRHDHLYRIHNYMKGLKIHDAQQRTLELHRDLVTMAGLLGRPLARILSEGPFRKDAIGDSSMLGLKPSLHKFHPRTEDDVISWDLVFRSLFTDTNLNPRRRIESPLREGLDDVIREVMEMINQYSRQRGRVIDFKEILYGYHRMNPLFGTDYILDMLLVYKKYRGRKMTVPVRRHAYLQQQFAGIEMRETRNGVEVVVEGVGGENGGAGTEEEGGGDPESSVGFKEGLIRLGEGLLLPGPQFDRNQEKVINFILPLSGRFKTFKRFMDIFDEVCLERREKVTLTVVLFPSDRENTVDETLALVKRVQAKYTYTKISVVPVFDTFARASALHLGTSQITDPDQDLLFFIDVDMIFTPAVLQRVRTNTIRGKMAYFPIVYSEFDPEIVYNSSDSPDHFRINEDTGYWRQYGFGIASVYKSDLTQVGGFDTTIRGWGKEDVDLFDKFVQASSNISVFRTVDPGLVHVFHVVECDANLNELQLQMCRATRTDTYGGFNLLSAAVYRDKNRIFRFAHRSRPEADRSGS